MLRKEKPMKTLAEIRMLPIIKEYNKELAGHKTEFQVHKDDGGTLHLIWSAIVLGRSYGLTVVDSGKRTMDESLELLEQNAQESIEGVLKREAGNTIT